MAAWVAVTALRVSSMWRAARESSLSQRQSRGDDRTVATGTSATDASGRASWGGGGTAAVTIVDAFSASGVTTTSSATAAAPSGGFVVANPLRHAAKVSGGC
jgi:hypothetical protein